jgi:hypothetical protein
MSQGTRRRDQARGLALLFSLRGSSCLAAPRPWYASRICLCALCMVCVCGTVRLVALVYSGLLAGGIAGDMWGHLLADLRCCLVIQAASGMPTERGQGGQESRFILALVF